MSQLPVPNPPNPVPPPPGTGDTYSQSAACVIELAMRDSGLIDHMEMPGSEDYRQYMLRLNALINFEQTQGLKLWLQENVTFTPVLNQQVYAWGPNGDIVMPRPTRIIEGFFTFPLSATSGIQTRYSLYQLSRQEFNQLGVLNVPGITNSFFVDKQQANLNLWLWLDPDAFTASATVTFVTQTQINQAISITDSMNFPIEWFQYLHWALASEIDIGQPAAVQQNNDTNRDMYRAALENFDVEDTSTYIQADPRVALYSGVGRFA
jgi:hypothetical protein